MTSRLSRQKSTGRLSRKPQSVSSFVNPEVVAPTAMTVIPQGLIKFITSFRTRKPKTIQKQICSWFVQHTMSCSTKTAFRRISREALGGLGIRRPNWPLFMSHEVWFSRSGAFGPIDFSLPAIPAELIEFAPISPGTALICYPEDLAAIALKILENAGFLLVAGRSGSGKSTYVLALGGLLSNAGYAVFRYRFDKLRSNPLRETSSFVSNCVKQAVVIIDDANAWATATDIQNLARLISNSGNVRLVLTWTNDDSEDDSRLSASDVPKQALTWLDLKATVTAVLLKHEGEIINALQKYEARNRLSALGVGHMDIGLQERIWALGDKPRTVYEFIFGLRGDQIAVSDEFRQAFGDDRADLPILVAAAEQIAGFEQPVTIEDVLQACRGISLPPGLPAATTEWVASVLERQVSKRRLIKVRDHFTTIHRKWAAKFIAAGLSSPVAKDTTEDLLRSYFQSSGDDPERLLRIWSWLGSVDGARPFVRRWENSMSDTDWRFLLRSCVEKGLEAVGSLANQRYRAPEGAMWPTVIENAFRENSVAITKLIYGTSPAGYLLAAGSSPAYRAFMPGTMGRHFAGLGSTECCRTSHELSRVSN